jgi:hypothetical protein
MNEATQSDGATGWALRAATLSAAVTTGALGVQYWLGLDEPVMAGGTVIAEVVGVFGLAKAARRLRAQPVSAVIGFVLVAMAAAWSGGTTWMKLDADARTRAAAVAVASPSYTVVYRRADVVRRCFRGAPVAPRAKPARLRLPGHHCRLGAIT